MANNLKMTFGYEDEQTRVYAFSVDDSLASGCKAKLLGINASLAAGTDGGLKDFFLSNAGASFATIAAAQLESSETIVLNIGDYTGEAGSESGSEEGSEEGSEGA